VQAFEEAVAHLNTPTAKADAIAYKLKKTAIEKMDEDPAFYRKFSQLIEDTIEEYRQGRLQELDYLQQMESALESLQTGQNSGVPGQIAEHADARAYWGLLLELFEDAAGGQLAEETQSSVADLSLELEMTINHLKIRDWTTSHDVANRMKTALEDHVYDFASQYDLVLTNGDLDTIIDSIVETAKRRDYLTS
jgi:type I restriction enzyme R subunit